jgi:hypothetical protein
MNKKQKIIQKKVDDLLQYMINNNMYITANIENSNPYLKLHIDNFIINAGDGIGKLEIDILSENN